ncbi:hypothetical protein Q5P01_005290 [Channa striata]|uniref:Thrombomodulin n=1 Tax=Channa striata TaxID=64152 RepID=A0AA88T159_CHASR|nr:hypothetical protein Q5P01_005290 [Channa striata]
MIRTTHCRLLAVFLLLGLEEAVLSQRGHCARDQCVAVFQESNNFPGAEARCKRSNGELLMYRPERPLASVLNGSRGLFWVRTVEGSVADLQMCSSVSVTAGFNLTTTPCRDTLDGFLCQYTLKDPCGRLQGVEGAQVRYVTHDNFEVFDSDTFPQGTSAIVEKVGGKYPESKHLCFEGNWLRAPWICEVLNGGCEHGCDQTNKTCTCPAKKILHPNNISCNEEPCAECPHGLNAKEGDAYPSTCDSGYRLAHDGRSCVDVDECKEQDECTGPGEQCVNTKGNFRDGECVNVSICRKCEHMQCERIGKVYQCKCREGFRVSPRDPTLCEKHCTERDCPATCVAVPKAREMQCFCPHGYIKDVRNHTTICTDIDECELQRQCDHTCENFFGGFRCLCDEGYSLHNNYMCQIDENEEDDGSGSVASHPTPGSAHPAAVPPYIKTGSVLGITVFMVLCMAMLFILARKISKRCGKFNISTFKTPDIDIFYLHQATTDTYKRLSFDKQFKNDSHRF